MGFFNVNHYTLSRQLLPVRLRKAAHKAWVKCLITPVATLYAVYMMNRSNNLYLLGHSSQVCYMEGALNDLFDPEHRRIYITDGAVYDAVPVYTDAEERPVWLATDGELPVSDYPAPVYLYTDAETSEFGFQFIIYYPGLISLDVNQMKALVNRYRLAGKSNYDIQTF